MSSLNDLSVFAAYLLLVKRVMTRTQSGKLSERYIWVLEQKKCGFTTRHQFAAHLAVTKKVIPIEIS